MTFEQPKQNVMSNEIKCLRNIKFLIIIVQQKIAENLRMVYCVARIENIGALAAWAS